MARYLLIDTATDELVSGLAEDTCVLAKKDHACRRKSNVELTSGIQELLRENPGSFDAVITGRGPGSFTGVRIGIATAKGLACGKDVPCYGVSTLDAIAYNVARSGFLGRLCVLEDAMRCEVYPAFYEISGKEAVERLDFQQRVETADSFFSRIEKEADTWTFTGNALVKYREEAHALSGATYLPSSLWVPTSEGLLAAYHNAAEKPTGDPALLLPIYTRFSDAEEHERTRLGLGSLRVEASGVLEELGGIHEQLRPALLSDAEALSALDALVYEKGGHRPYTAEEFSEMLAHTYYSLWVAHDQETLTGYALGRICKDGFELMSIGVLPAYRRRGLAGRLLDRLAYDGGVLGAKRCFLEVSCANAPARHLYEKIGFSQVGLRKKYYLDGSDALVLEAKLPFLEQSCTTQTEKDSREKAPVLEAEQKARAGSFPKGLILAIETSCDETAMSIIDNDGNLLANVVSTQIDFHARFGGVVPEIASRKHTEALVGVFEQTLLEAGCRPSDLDAIAVTQGPGLVGALVVGIAFAKGLSVACGAKLIGVNHLEGHILANMFENPELKPPFVASIVSGGHTLLVHVKAWDAFEVLGSTIDDAVGEAFDKVSKALGLGYPGGPIISRLAEKGNPDAIAFPRAMLHSHDYRFSLSGLKTAVVTYLAKEERAKRAVNVPDVAASFQAAVIDVLVSKIITACKETGVSDFCLGGGVAANPALRNALTEKLTQLGITVTLPALQNCTDNAAMIALVALRKAHKGDYADLRMDAKPQLSL